MALFHVAYSLALGLIKLINKLSENINFTVIGVSYCYIRMHNVGEQLAFTLILSLPGENYDTRDTPPVTKVNTPQRSLHVVVVKDGAALEGGVSITINS